MLRFLCVLCLFCVKSWAQITEVHSLDEIREHFKDKSSSTFAVFDIDMVLIQPDDPAFQMLNIERYYPVAKRIILSVPRAKRDILYTLTSMNCDSVLVDQDFPCFFDELRANGITAMGLTASMTGSLLHIPSLEAWKIEHLTKNGIHFKESAPCDASMTFCNLPSNRGNYPMLFEGVLFTNGGFTCSKGEAYVAFLKDAGLYPREVIFIDDKEDNLKSVESALLAYDPWIRFTGLHYLGARYYPSLDISEEEFAHRWEILADMAMLLD